MLFRSGDGGDSYGLMQVKYTTAKELGYKGRPNGLLDPQTNLKFGCLYLSKMYEQTDDLYRSLDAYSRGPVNESKSPYKGDWSKHPYVGKILKVLNGEFK